MWRRFWQKIEPWLTRAGHLDLLFIQTGLGSLIMSGLSGVFAGFLAWWHDAPIYQIYLGILFGAGGVLFVANQALRLITTSKIPSSLSRQQARRLDRVDPGGIRIGGNTVFVVTVLSAALLIVSGVAITNWYSSWRRDVENTYLDFIPRNPRVNTDDNDHPFMVTLTSINPGNLRISGTSMTHRFEYPDRRLTSDEEDRVFKSMDAILTYPRDNGSYINPHTSYNYFTVEDRRFDNRQWTKFQAGALRIYLFIEYKYLVAGYVKTTEYCAFYQAIDFPSAHGCIGHNRWRWN